MCPFRIMLLHHAPVTSTLEGERPDIWTFLGTDRLAPPILEHNPDLVLHGHAHAGTFEGRLGEVPVYNVSVRSWARTGGCSSSRGTAASPPRSAENLKPR